MSTCYKKIWILLCLFVGVMISGCSASQNGRMEQAGTLSNTIETKWFTLEVPDNWTGLYVYEEQCDEGSDQINVEVSMKSKNESGKAFLFSVEFSPLEDVDYIVTSLEGEWLDPIGIITIDDGTSYFISSYSASEAACTEDEMDQFIELADGIDECLMTFKPKYDEQFQVWDEDIFQELKANIDTTPHVPYTLNILGNSLESYKNQTGFYFYDITDRVISDYYLINQLEGVSYYGCENGVVAVENSSIVALAWITSSSSEFGTGSTEPTMREVINAGELTELFDIAPEVLSVDGKAVSLYTWRGENGYIGIKAVGSADPKWMYNNSVPMVMMYTDKKFCSLYN